MFWGVVVERSVLQVTVVWCQDCWGGSLGASPEREVVPLLVRADRCSGRDNWAVSLLIRLVVTRILSVSLFPSIRRVTVVCCAPHVTEKGNGAIRGFF